MEYPDYFQPLGIKPAGAARWRSRSSSASGTSAPSATACTPSRRPTTPTTQRSARRSSCDDNGHIWSPGSHWSHLVTGGHIWSQVVTSGHRWWACTPSRRPTTPTTQRSARRSSCDDDCYVVFRTLLAGLLSPSDESSSLARCRDVLNVSTVFLSGLWASPLLLFSAQMLEGIRETRSVKFLCNTAMRWDVALVTQT